MRALILLTACGVAFGQAPDPAYEPLARAYDALRARDYDGAIAGFQAAVSAAPKRASIRKDLGYAYLKIGENELARDQFGEAMAMDPADRQVALEYAFLCYETKQRQEARRVFDRIRKTGNATAEQAFQNIDAPLAAGIERWKKALELGGDSFSAHFELATLAEERDDLELAAEHYQKAWRILPDRRTVLVDLGRVWKALARTDDANAALLAASRGGEPRAAEMARELLPNRYPYVSEFRHALGLDPGSGELRRELAYLLLKMDRQPEAEQEFRVLAETAPDDLLSATQLGFLLFARGERDRAAPLFDRVLAGKDEDLANRVRAVLRMPQVHTRQDAQPASIDAKVMAERSIKAGYIKDALKYLQIAHEADPGDFGLVLKLGWAFNLLRKDAQALRWFDLARRSTDPQISTEAAAAFRNLRRSTQRLRTSAWLFPTFSSRWRDLFAYGQVKTELRTHFPVSPYVSLRFIGDARRSIGGISPQYLSESSFIFGLGLRTPVWRGATAWAEAGSAVSYVTRHMLPDYRAGVSLARGTGRALGGESSGWFGDTTLDGVFISRYGNDFLLYQQSRAGYAAGRQAQFYWNANVTVDSRGEGWANFVETGPGLRLNGPALSGSSYFTLNAVRGAYLKAGRAPFSDIRAGFWYAFTH
jgi:tetratricopeptide (TPR) repeat protein